MSISPTRAADSGLCLGLDFGTSGARACLIDAGGLPCHEQTIPFESNTWQEWSAALEQLLSGLPSDARPHVQAIAICGTSATSLLCDETGKPLLPALLYNQARPITDDGFIPDGHLAASATSSLAKLLHLLEQADITRAGFFLHQADWLAFRLHGIPGISDYHNSLKLGYDVADLRYPEWLAKQPFARLLPVVRVPGHAIGPVLPDIARVFGLPPGCIVRTGTTDSIAAFFASGASMPGEAVTSLGSTMVLKLLSRHRVDAPEYGVYSHRCGNAWLAGGASNCGGRVLDSIFGRQRLASLAEQIDPGHATGLDYYPLPGLGERFPVSDPQLPPRLEPRPVDDVLYLQGLLESLARIEAQGYRLLERLGATSLHSVLTAGGGAANTAWESIRASTLGVPVKAAPHTQAAYGAARLAQRGEKLLYSATP